MIAGAFVAAAGTAVQTGGPAVFTWPGFFMSPGFGGAAALFAAVLGGGVALFLGHKAKGAEKDKLSQEKSDGDLDRCWERFTWAVDMEVDKEKDFKIYVLIALLTHLSHDAKRLGDKTLLKVITEYNGDFIKDMMQDI